MKDITALKKEGFLFIFLYLSGHCALEGKAENRGLMSRSALPYEVD